MFDVIEILPSGFTDIKGSYQSGPDAFKVAERAQALKPSRQFAVVWPSGQLTYVIHTVKF